MHHTEVVIAPPALYLLLANEITRKDVAVASQNVFDKGNGAYTGEISAEQLKDAGIQWVLIGHSERRSLLGESDQFIASKTKAALEQGLNVILCIGESLEVCRDLFFLYSGSDRVGRLLTWRGLVGNSNVRPASPSMS